jgi:hypothetical protein
METFDCVRIFCLGRTDALVVATPSDLFRRVDCFPERGYWLFAVGRMLVIVLERGYWLFAVGRNGGLFLLSCRKGTKFGVVAVVLSR